MTSPTVPSMLSHLHADNCKLVASLGSSQEARGTVRSEKEPACQLHGSSTQVRLSLSALEALSEGNLLFILPSR